MDASLSDNGVQGREFAWTSADFDKVQDLIYRRAGISLHDGKHAMVYSAAADRVILFGGQVGWTEFEYTGETWTYELNTNTWTNVTPHP